MRLESEVEGNHNGRFMNPHRSTRTRWLLRAIKLLIVLLVIAAAARTLYGAWSELGEQPLHLEPAWLVLSGALYLAAILPAALFWHHVLRTLGQNARFLATLRAYYLGHLGKYVPGKALVVVIRAGLIGGDGVHVGVAAASVFVETLTMMAAGSFLSAAILMIGFHDQELAWWLRVGAVALMLISVLPTVPPVFRFLMRLLRIGQSDPEIAEKTAQLSYKTLLLGWALMACWWLLCGLSYWATLRAMGIPGLDPVVQLPRFTAAVSLATVGGFAVLFIPGGLGARELVLVEVMIPYLSTLVRNAKLTAWTAAALLRVVWVVSELLISVILYWIGSGRRIRSDYSSTRVG